MSEMPDARNLSRAELRKAIVRLRLEMQRQQLRQEGELLLQPLKQARHVGQSLRGGLAGNIPLWAPAAPQPWHSCSDASVAGYGCCG